MGVKNLWLILSPVCERRSLWDLHDKTVAIDLGCWVCDSQNVEHHGQPRMYLRNLFFRTSCLLLLGVKPVFVLDGEAPSLKHDVMSQRISKRYQHRKPNTSSEEDSTKCSQSEKWRGTRSQFNSILRKCRELLRIMGVPCIQASGEAEALCALLNELGIVDGCITQDGDCFLYGAQKVFRNFTISQQGSTGYSIEVYEMSIVKEKLGLSREKLIALSLLCGCDYNDKGVLGVGKESALKFLERLEDNEVLNRLRQWRSDPYYERLDAQWKSLNTTCTKCCHEGKLNKHTKSGCVACGTLFGCTETTDTTHLSQLDPDERKVVISELTMRKKALQDESFPSESVIQEFMHKELLPELDLNWKQPIVTSFVDYSVKFLSWTESYALEKIFPLVTRWQLHLKKIGSINMDHPSLPVIPDIIVKERVLKGVKSFEVKWKDNHGFQFQMENIEDLLVTIEPQDMFTEAYPNLVQDYYNEKDEKKKKGKTIKKRTKSKGTPGKRCPCHSSDSGKESKHSSHKNHICGYIASSNNSEEIIEVRNALSDLDVNSDDKKPKRRNGKAMAVTNRSAKTQPKVTFNCLYKLVDKTCGQENKQKQIKKDSEGSTDEKEHCETSSLCSNVPVLHEHDTESVNFHDDTGILAEFALLDADDDIMDLSDIISSIINDN